VTAPATAAVDAASRYEVVIGIEIHVQLKTASKMFCSCSTEVRGAAPNTNTCPVCLGLPGALPVINRRAVELVLATGLAIEASIPEVTRWDRKNYFYPDLPKGYQISQYDLPLTAHGKLLVETTEGTVEVGITRAHLEEDTARLLHQDAPGGGRLSLVDFNRSGIPLMEIVTDPVIHSAEAARRYAEELRLLLVTIGASDAAMEEGQMRVEANVSLRPRGTTPFGTKVEVKNMNSFRSVERAIGFEIERQTRALDTGEPLVQETRGWDDTRAVTYTMRLKEESQDYRYFPEPDLPPLRTDAAWLTEIRAALPELPQAREARYRTDYGLSAYDAAVIVSSGSEYFDAAMSAGDDLDPKRTASLYSKLALRELKSSPGLLADRDPAQLALVSSLVSGGLISSQNAEQVYARHLQTGEPVDAIVSELGLRQISDRGALGEAIEKVLGANPAAVADYAAGKTVVIKFLVGQVMKETRGQAHAVVVQELLEERLAARLAAGLAAPGSSS
jgi:aspartyl-tRNA(Asn)/glutamyl-tRNA(Gln) amidotransferase subunit B